MESKLELKYAHIIRPNLWIKPLKPLNVIQSINAWGLFATLSSLTLYQESSYQFLPTTKHRVKFS